MTDINISSVDLNLLVVLEAVLHERSATRAAARLHVTQSAVSSALRRLRAVFDDALVIRTPHGFVPTARAEALLPALDALLHAARRLLAAPASAAAASERVFTIACTDAIGVTLLPALMARLAAHTPAARVRLVTLEHELSNDGLERGEVDLLIGVPPTTPNGCRGELVYEEPMLCVVRRDHPRVGTRLTLATYAALPHIELALFGEPDDDVDRALARKGLTRRIALQVPHFASIPFAVAASDCVAVLSERLAHAYAQPLALRILPPPLALPRLAVRQYWHRRAHADRALVQLRALVRQAAAQPKRRGTS